jgi:formate hydrogenlyase subunit 6/NADH:ubiquinone oxidoreductase subunit I
MGILTIGKTITQNLFSRPPTSRYPAEPAKRFELTRGHLAFEPEKCRVCRVCMLRCPTQAILVDRENRTWECNHFRCITCGNCVELCPADCLHLEPAYRSPEVETTGKEFHEIPEPPPKPEAGGEAAEA